MSDVDDLFDDDDEPQQQQPPQQELADSPQQQQRQHAGGMEDLEDDMGEEQQPDEADLFGSPGRSDEEAAAVQDEPTGEPITVSAPLLKRPRADQMALLRVPNVIKVDPLPYDPDTTDIEPEEVYDNGKKRTRPNDINVIRWRYRQNEDGTLTRESNARYVKWSDGTESIVLGDEVLMMERKQQPRANTYVHVVRYDAIQGLSHIKKTIHCKPASLNSKLHQRLKMTVHKASAKADKVQVHLAARNPEQEKLEAEKRAEEMARLRRSQARVTERVRAPKPRVPNFTAAYIEQDEEEEEEPDYFAAGGNNSDDDGGGYNRRGRDDEEAAARLQSAKRASTPPVGSSMRSSKQPRPAAEQEEEDEEMAAAPAAKAAPGLTVRRGAILDDEDDD